MKNKKSLVIIAILLTLSNIILIGIFLFTQYYSVLIKNESFQNEWVCEKQFKIYNKDECYFQLAEAKKDIFYCDKISIPYDKVGPLTGAKYNCYMNIALINNDEKICEKISNIWIHNWCLTQIFMIKKDVLICEKMTNHDDFKDDCYKDFAKYTNDINICKLIKNDSAKEWCNSYFNQKY